MAKAGKSDSGRLNDIADYRQSWTNVTATRMESMWIFPLGVLRQLSITNRVEKIFQ